MNKTTLYTGIIYTSIGLALFTIALLGEYPYEAFLWGLGGGSIGTGISLLWRYFYWKRPSKENDYQKRLELQKCDANFNVTGNFEGKVTSILASSKRF